MDSEACDSSVGVGDGRSSIGNSGETVDGAADESSAADGPIDIYAEGDSGDVRNSYDCSAVESSD